jgi:hypothetical protein
MVRDELFQAFAAFGAACTVPAEIVIVGGAAGILCRWLERATVDVDVAASDPRLSLLAPIIEAVAEELDLPARWLNDGAKAFAAVLPPDYATRLVPVGRFGSLVVHAIGRGDFIVMKLFAMRAEDVADLRTLRPTADEVAFVRAQLPRIARFDPARAHLMELYLAQGDGGGET